MPGVRVLSLPGACHLSPSARGLVYTAPVWPGPGRADQLDTGHSHSQACDQWTRSDSVPHQTSIGRQWPVSSWCMTGTMTCDRWQWWHSDSDISSGEVDLRPGCLGVAWTFEIYRFGVSDMTSWAEVTTIRIRGQLHIISVSRPPGALSGLCCVTIIIIGRDTWYSQDRLDQTLKQDRSVGKMYFQFTECCLKMASLKKNE